MSAEANFEEAKRALSAAIAAYHQATESEVFIDDWVLVVHKDSIELTAEGASVVGLVTPTGQAFHRTAGLLAVASAVAVGN